MESEAFFDTNVLLYALTPDESKRHDARRETAEKLMNSGGKVSVQVYSEFADVARRKFRKSWRDIEELIYGVELFCGPPIPTTARLHRTARGLSERYQFRIFDSLVLAAALEAGCTVLYTEDLQHGQ